MRLLKIIQLFDAPTRPGQQETIGRKVFKTLPDFGRRIEMLQNMEQMKKICELYHEEEQKEIKRIITEYCDEENTKHKGETGYKEKKLGNNVNTVPSEKMGDMIRWREEKLQTDVKIKSFLFTPDELKAADLTIEELSAFKDFYNAKELTKQSKK